MTFEIFADFCRYLLFFIFPGKLSRCSLFKNKLTPVHPRVVSDGFYKTRHEMRSFCETHRDVHRFSKAMESGNSSNTDAPSHGDGVGNLNQIQLGFSSPCPRGDSNNTSQPTRIQLGALRHCYDLFLIRKHGPVQCHDGLRGTKRPTHRPGMVCPGLQGKNTGPLGILQHQADGYYYGEQMCGLVWERETECFVGRGISEEVRNRLR